MTTAFATVALILTARGFLRFNDSRESYAQVIIMVSAILKFLEDAAIATFFFYVSVTIFKLKRLFLQEEFRFERGAMALLIFIVAINIFVSTSSCCHRIIRYQWAVDHSKPYVWYRQLCLHIVYKFVIFANAMSMLYLFIRII